MSMKVQAQISIPDKVEVTITIVAPLSQLESFRELYNGRRERTKLDELICAAIRKVSAELRGKVETLIEQTPQNT